MNLSELLLILLVALLVFGPNKLSMVARHLGKLVRYVNHYRQKATLIWQEQVNIAQLQENSEKAKQADSVYQKQEEKQE